MSDSGHSLSAIFVGYIGRNLRPMNPGPAFFEVNFALAANWKIFPGKGRLKGRLPKRADLRDVPLLPLAIPSTRKPATISA
jgi:hypothetical protein